MQSPVKCILILFAVFFTVTARSQNAGINIIPKPVFIEGGKGSFIINKHTKIFYDKGASATASFLANFLRKPTGYAFPLVSTASSKKQKGIYLHIKNDFENTAKGAYSLLVDLHGIRIFARDEEGLFNGVQSLRQLLPPAVESPKALRSQRWMVPWVRIKDAPQFQWRGYMQDISRTFYGPEVLKKYMDAMALYKLNVLHLHLTDDQGWRIEIKKYPELTSPKTTIFPEKFNEPAERSGFYTQAQMKELIAYAAERHITIVPEIDIPGHAWPIIITHPELGVNKTTAPDYVFPFLASWGYWGFQFTPNPLDPTKEEVYTFLDNVFGEIAALFPSSYIHFGGDEVVHRLWESEPHVQAFMKEKNLSDVKQLQSYFMSRVGQMIIKRGKKPIGWNDILSDAKKLPKETGIMSWLGEEAIKQAASNGFYTVASPSDYLYFDITQDSRDDGTMCDLAYPNTNSLESVYNFNPLKGLTAGEEKYVLGLQACMWPAIPQEVKDINVQNFPRLLAVSEAAWTPLKEKDFSNFKTRLPAHYVRLDTLRIDYFKKGGYIAGTWEPDRVETTFKTTEWEVTKRAYGSGRVIAGFFYTGGASFLKVKNVQLLENGKVISSDAHESLADTYRATSKPKTFLYRLSIDDYKPGAKYVLRADIAGAKSSDSKGNVTFNLAPYKPFTVVETMKNKR